MTKSKTIKALLFNGLLITLAMTSATNAQASVQRHAEQASAGSLQATKDALDLSMMERVQQLKGDSHSFENLKTLMFSKDATMELRWKAVTAMGRVGGAKAKPELEHALQSPEWFMRNAGLLAMASADRAEGLVWARRLLNDKALVVRAAAVDTIAQSRDVTSTNLLWTKLYSKENYRNRQSLFIRRRIVEALGEIDGKAHTAKFVALLQDKDQSLHEPAMEALERITKHSVGNPGDPMQARRAQWQQWYKVNKASL